MKLKAILLASLFALSLVLSACPAPSDASSEGRVDETVNSVDNAVENAGDTLEEAGDAVENATDQ